MGDESSLTLPNVINSLKNLTSGTFVKQAEATLLNWQTEHTNTYAYLLLCATLENEVRLAALLSLKATVTKTWKDRGRRKPQIFLEEPTKQRIRQLLLSFVTGGENPLISDEAIPQEYRCHYQVNNVVENKTVQSAAASCLVQIARFDLPKAFPELIPSLMSTITSSELDAQKKRNSLYALEAIMDEFATRRMLGGKQYMASLGQSHLASLVEKSFVPSLQIVITQGPEKNASSLLVVEYAMLSVKTIHHILVSALPYLPGNEETNSNLDRLFSISLEFSSAILSKPRESSSTQQVLTSLWEMVVDIQHTHPILFGRFLEPFLELFYVHVVSGKTEVMPEDARLRLQHYSKCMQDIQLSEESTVILALRFLANVANASQYIPDETINEAVATAGSQTMLSQRAISSKGDAAIDISSIQRAVHTVWSKFFTTERICILTDLCICTYMILSEPRLSEWHEDPEDFFLKEMNRTVDHDVAAAAQDLYCALAESKVGQNVVIPRLIILLRDTQAQKEACNVETSEILQAENQITVYAHRTVLLWESIYTASGLSETAVDAVSQFFNEWYTLCLGQCISTMISRQNQIRYLPLLRRRIIWLFGCYSSAIDGEFYPMKILLNLIEASPQNDAAVKLSAVQSLKSLLYDFEKSLGESSIIAESAISSLYRLAGECAELESQSEALECISVILSSITGMGQALGLEAANAAVIPLPSLWNTAPLLRDNALSILSAVAVAVGKQEAEKLHQVAFSMIDNVFVESEENLYLIKDALSLWLTLLRLSQSYQNYIGSIFPRIKGILDNDFEHVKTVMMVAECYILIGGDAFLSQKGIGETLLKLLECTVGEVRPKGAMYVSLLLEALLRTCPEKGVSLLLHGGILKTMIRSCVANSNGEKHCEPDRVIVLYLSTIARTLLQSPQQFHNVLLDIPKSAEVAQQLIELFYRLFNHEQNYGSPDKLLRQKLWLLSLLSLLPESPSVSLSPLSTSTLNSFDQMMSLCLNNFKYNLDNGSATLVPLSVDYDSEEETVVAGSEEYNILLQRALLQDIAYNTDLVECFKLKMSKLILALGNEAHQQLLALVEPVTLRQLEAILK